MIDLTRALRQLAWADAWLFDRLAEYPPEAMLARFAPEGWSVARLAIHIVDGAEWYRYCLAGVPWSDLTPPSTEPEPLQTFVCSLAPHLVSVDAELLELAGLPDAAMTFTDEEGERTALRSTILTQAFLHSVEHRAQIGAALQASGFAPLPLDDVDLWAFERFERGDA
jgi:uncharacterized damage-inducible protein DinB